MIIAHADNSNNTMNRKLHNDKTLCYKENTPETFDSFDSALKLSEDNWHHSTF